MEELTLGDCRSSKHSSCTAVSRPRSPRLPTPEASRSSNDAIDFCNSNGVRSGAPVYSMLSKASPERAMSRMSDQGMYYRNDRHRSAPHSPPYCIADSQKPSLPPLKTVLADNMSSPPQTPTMLTAPFQPSPREPAYTATTYKPPALYPNKKQRTDSLVDAGAPYATASRFSSPGLPSASYEPRTIAGARRPEEHLLSASQHPSFDQTRRYSVQQPSNDRTGVAMLGPSSTIHHYRTPERTPTSASFGSAFPPTPSIGMPSCEAGFVESDRVYYRQSHPTARRSSEAFSGYRGGPAYENGRFQSHGHAVRLHGRDQFGQDSDERYFDSRRGHLPPQPGSHFPSQYEGGSGVGALFTPSHYDYQHGKARKRSNLPKQSTEIMKTWFDQNIGNPYPSEEQKALFSNATGISMTQVSNWFINHRRRCPELRDKRERTRSHGRDGDY